MSETTTEEVAASYLDKKAEAKALAEEIKGLEKELDTRLADGDQLTVRGAVYKWTISVGKSVSYKKVLDWLHTKVQPDVQVLIEEGQALPAHNGSRTTKSLKPVAE